MRKWINAILFLSLTACQPSSLNKAGLLHYIDVHESLSPGLKLKDLDAQVRFVPAGLMVNSELPASAAGKRSEVLDSLNGKYAGQYYFRLLLSINNKEAIRQLGSFGRYSEMLQVLAFQMDKYVQCVTDNHDTLPLMDYSFERTFGMTAANTLLLAFDRAKIDKSERFKIIVQECGFGVGNMEFSYRTGDLRSVPKLKQPE